MLILQQTTEAIVKRHDAQRALADWHPGSNGMFGRRTAKTTEGRYRRATASSSRVAEQGQGYGSRHWPVVVSPNSVLLHEARLDLAGER